MGIHEFTQGFQYPRGYQLLNPYPVDSWSGPYAAGSTTDAVAAANLNIPPNLRYLSQQVRILAPNPSGGTLSYIFWYRGTTADSGLVEFASGGGGGIVGNYVSTFNGQTGDVFGATLGGVNVWTNLNTFNAGITTAFLYASTGSTFGGTLQVNGGATFGGRVDIVGVLDVVSGATFESTTDHGGVARFTAGITTNTIDVSGAARFNGGLTASAVDVTGLARFAGGISAAGATLGRLVVNSGISAAGGITLNGVVNVSSGVTFSSTTDHTGLARFAGGITTAFLYASTGSTFGGTLQVNGGATLGGRVDVGGVLDVVGGATFENTSDFVGIARFAGGISAAGATLGRLFVNGGLTATRVDTGTLASSGAATLNSLNVTNNATVGGTLDVYGNLYVAGTLTTVNETQLLIQDKYLVLGSTFTTGPQANGAGIYIGSTTSAIAGICYSNGSSEWSSTHSFDIPSASFYRIGGNNVLASTYLGSVITGSSLESVGTLTNGVWNASVIGLAYGGTNKNLSTVGASGGVVFKDGTGLSITSAGTNGQILQANSNGAPTWVNVGSLAGLCADKVLVNLANQNQTYRLLVSSYFGNDYYTPFSPLDLDYNPVTSVLTVGTSGIGKLEAIVDGGTWV